jgi:hypothetical protein
MRIHFSLQRLISMSSLCRPHVMLSQLQSTNGKLLFTICFQLTFKIRATPPRHFIRQANTINSYLPTPPPNTTHTYALSHKRKTSDKLFRITPCIYSLTNIQSTCRRTFDVVTWTPPSKHLVQTLKVAQLDNKLPALHKSRKPNVVTLTARYKALARASWIQQTPMQSS